MRKTKHATIESATNGFIVYFRDLDPSEDSLFSEPASVYATYEEARAAIDTYFIG